MGKYHKNLEQKLKEEKKKARRRKFRDNIGVVAAFVVGIGIIAGVKLWPAAPAETVTTDSIQASSVQSENGFSVYHLD